MTTQKEKLNNIEIYFRKAVRENNFSKLVATVSGGADSVALVCALSKTDADIIALHCNFHLRGEESMRDQRHVECICSNLMIPLIVKDFDVPGYIDCHSGVSTEMACRELRYNWFYQIAEETSSDRIVTGHNADDNIETLFLNLLRGSGTSGLKGMLPDNGRIWRPLLKFHRKEIEKYLNDIGIGFITDSSNLSNDYRRNFIRNEIIPLFKTRWEGFDKALDRSISLLRSENDVVQAMVGLNMPPQGEALKSSTVMAFPDPELLIRRYIEPLKPFTTTATEVVGAIRANKPDRKIWKLPKGTLILQGNLLRLSINEQ